MRGIINRRFGSCGLFVVAAPVVVSALLAWPAKGQAPGSDTTRVVPKPRAFCWQGHPGGVCRTFLVVEAGLYMKARTTVRQAPSVTPEVVAAFGNHATWELGAMRTIGPRSAVGATGLVGVGGADSWRVGGHARYRYWLTDQTHPDGEISVDGAAGLVRVSLPDREGQPAGAVATTDLRLNFGDRAALTGRVDWPLSSKFATGHAMYGGVTLASKHALVGTGLAVAAVIAWLMLAAPRT